MTTLPFGKAHLKQLFILWLSLKLPVDLRGLHIKMLHKKFALFSLSLTLFEATFSLSPRQLFSLSPTLFEETFFIVWYMFNNIISITLYCYLINITFLIFSFPQKLSKSNWKVFYDENFQLHLMNLIRSGTASAACKWRDPKWRIIDIWWCAACRVPWCAVVCRTLILILMVFVPRVYVSEILWRTNTWNMQISVLTLWEYKHIKQCKLST